MASKSKRRRRVLGASCILAALIVAGSSFAWFTSKDEVTNRLTASADYGVSIIENFAPPKQWTPGQTVTKEEAVTNTGNVDAFVKQKITADMEVTVEVPVATAPTFAQHDGYIELKPSEYGSIEAGSYVAWAPNADDIGRKVVFAMDTADHSTSDPTDFTPSKTGLYIFRRAITTDAQNDKLVDTAYEYVGYYYVLNNENDATKGGKYYKLNTIDKNTLELATSGDGNLAKAPTVRYSMEETKTLKNVPMVYDGTTPKLTVTYETDRHSNSAQLDTADKAAYDAYNAYLDALKGATKWDNTRTAGIDSTHGAVTTVTDKIKAGDSANTTGLTDFDEFTTDTAADVKADLSNWSLERLQERAQETQRDLDSESPSGSFTDANWKAAYDEAVKERKTVNLGVRSAQRLKNLKTELEGIIGTTSNGLNQDSDYGFFYSSDLYTVDPATGAVTVQAPVVNLLNTSKYKNVAGANSDTNGEFLTLDNMNDTTGNYAAKNFAEANINGDASVSYDGENAADFGDDSLARFSNKTGNFGAQFDYANASDETGKLKDLWNKYVVATKKQVLIDAKIKLVEDAITDSEDATTDVGRTPQELQEMLTSLKSQKRIIDAGLTSAKNNYENYVTGTIKKYIDEMNEDQKEINAANQVSKATGGSSYGATKPADGADAAAIAAATATYTMSGGKSTVFSNGTDLTGKEKAFYDFLINTYGVAYRDTAGTDAYKEYAGEADGAAEANAKWRTDNYDLYADIATYSRDVTEAKVDACLTETDGKLALTTDNSILDTQLGTSDDSTRIATKAAIEGAPYFIDKKVDTMVTKREGDVAALLNDYNVAKATAVAYADQDVNVTQPIVINVNLDNIGDGNVKDQWQYIEGATGNADKEFNFYYTSILGSGETSSLLIKSVDMGSNVDQNSFRNLKFDLNVGSESAQVVFDGDYAKADAANASITGANTTKDKYLEGDPVQWKKDSTVTAPITDQDPQGKATKTV